MKVKAGASTRTGCIFHNCGKIEMKAVDPEDVKLLTWLFLAWENGFLDQLSRDWDPRTRTANTDAPGHQATPTDGAGGVVVRAYPVFYEGPG